MNTKSLFACSVLMTLMFLGFQWFQFTSLKAKFSREEKFSQYRVQQYDDALKKGDELQKSAVFNRLVKLEAYQNTILQEACGELFWISKAYALFVLLLSFYFLKAVARQQKANCAANLPEPPKP